MELLKLLSTSEIFAQVVSFLLLLALLRAFAWKRLLKLLDDRKARIAAEFNNIEKAKADVEGMKSAYEERLAKVGDEARERISEAINEARRLAAEVKAKAEKDSEEIFKDARENIKVEVAKAREDLKDQIADLSIAVAEKVIQERLSEGGEKKLALDFLNRLETKK